MDYRDLYDRMKVVEVSMGVDELTELYRPYKRIYESLSIEDRQKLMALVNKKSVQALKRISKQYRNLRDVVGANGILTKGPTYTLLKTAVPSPPVTLTDRLRYAKISEEGLVALQTQFPALRGFALLPPYKLHDHQESAITDFILNREANPHRGVRGGIAALAMGLGKTLLGLAIIAATVPKPFTACDINATTVFPNLVICSKSVMYEWRSNIEKFFGRSLKVLYFHRDYTDASILNRITRAEILKYDVVVTTYDVMVIACKDGKKIRKRATTSVGFFRYSEVRPTEGRNINKIMEVRLRDPRTADIPDRVGKVVLFCTPWRRIIADESQRFVNPKTLTYRAIMALHGDVKWCLSGTPIKNYQTDVWAQLRFCGYSGHTVPKRWSIDKFRKHTLNDCILSLDYDSPSVKNKITVPIKNTRIVEIVHGLNEHKLHAVMLKAIHEAIDAFVAGLAMFDSILVLFLRLRQVSVAGFLILEEAKRKKDQEKIKDQNDIIQTLRDGDMGKWLVDKEGTAGMQSAKMRAIVDIIRNIPVDEHGHREKVLIFSAFTSCLDLVEDLIDRELPDVGAGIIDGSVTGEERIMIRDRFRVDPNFSVLLLQYKVGSEGLNLQEANHVILIECWWNEATHQQAEARCWRPGQTKQVTVYKLLVTNSIEVEIMRLCLEKRKMARNFILHEDNELKEAHLDLATIMRLVGYEE